MPDRTIQPERPVFLDESGARFRRMQRLGGVLVAAALVLAIGFVVTVLRSPQMTQAPLLANAGQRFQPRVGSVRAERRLYAAIARDENQRRLIRPGIQPQIMAAYYAPWDPDALVSFKAHATELTHIYPAWLQLTDQAGAIDSEAWTPGRHLGTNALTRSARTNGVRIVPVLSNASGGVFSIKRVVALAASRQAQDKLQANLLKFVDDNGYDGLQVDFELWTHAQIQVLTPFLRRLHTGLAAKHREFSITLEEELPTEDIRTLSASADYVVLMAYDEHSDTDDPGPIASATFIDRTLRKFIALVPTDKLVLGVAAFGYDWNGSRKTADSVTNPDALALAQGYRDQEKPSDVIDFDNEALQATFQYKDDDGDEHTVWFSDAAAVANAVTLGKAYHVRGAALWALGDEDPSSWLVFGLKGRPDADMSVLKTSQAVQFTGDGDLLRIISAPTSGTRAVERDAKTGLITDETYQSYASGWLLRRSGAPEMTVTLTFDDGPDTTWTPKILDILKRRGVKASFFMIGQEAAKHPELVRRVYAEGHEIGNHSFTHPNMARVGEDRVRLELTATQRALASIIGRQITLFRPPYNADSEPGSYGEIMPVSVAGKLGYVTAGESIDPEDWNTPKRGDDGAMHNITAQEILDSTLSQLGKGHAILLHDAGGDRAATVAALDPLITALQQRGYKIVTMGELEGRPRDQTMPQLPRSQRNAIAIDTVSFAIGLIFQRTLFWAFVTAIVLGLIRISLMIALAARHKPDRPVSDMSLTVEVLVAAFNEAQVITRTIDSLLASTGIAVRVIVVDDGSTDGTAEVVSQRYGDDPRVRLFTKSNGGKASALNLALTHASTDVVVGVDADTQLPQDALEQLCLWFADPKVGAVAGNVLVGNRAGVVTRWQSIEYITSQNIDRRALARLNAITVVPGAIGGWRREALVGVGGYQTDTLAEDMDLTWRIRRAGWVIANEPHALAYTEAPHNLSGLLKQRFRWTYGTLQCLWKHRAATFHYGWFGKLSLPTLWLFQIAGQILAPLIDLQIVLALVSRAVTWIDQIHHADSAQAPDPTLWLVVAIYIAFVGLELAAGWVAYGLEGLSRKELWLLPTQRLVYRQIMYIVVWRAISRAFGGVSQGWGKLKRQGSVLMQVRS